MYHLFDGLIILFIISNMRKRCVPIAYRLLLIALIIDSMIDCQ